MKRKLFSMLLSAFALLLLMGAGLAPQQTAALLAEEESAGSQAAALETDVQSLNHKVSNLARSAAVQGSTLVQEANVDTSMLIDGAYAPTNLGKFQENGVTYVALAPMANLLDDSAQVNWNKSTGTVTVTAGQLELTAQTGQLYLEANGRYLYIPEGVRVVNDRVTIPLWAVAEAFDAKLSWDASTGSVVVTRGSGAIQSGDSYYDQDILFWLSRIISAESGNQPLEGQMSVGSVVMNRVASPLFPNTVKEVLAQKNQFSPYKGGKLAERTPNASSVIAAKLVLDGGVVEETEGALYFDANSKSWAARNKECIAVIGGHKFYR